MRLPAALSFEIDELARRLRQSMWWGWRRARQATTATIWLRALMTEL